MKKTIKKIQFANGDEMDPVAINGKNFYSQKDVERKILELEDGIRVTQGNANLAYALNDFLERDKKELARALWKARALAISRLNVDQYIRTHLNSHYWKCGDEIFNMARKAMQNKIERAKAILLKKAEDPME